MGDKISAKEYTLWDLMEGKYVFNVPEYQRPYSWTEKESVSLLEDLLECWENNQGRDNYFVGSIVLVNKELSSEAEIIDGQQRLTTISIILSTILQFTKTVNNDIKKCLWEDGIQHQNIDGRSRVLLRKRDREFYENYIATSKINELLSRDPKQLADDAQRLIQNNARCIYERINEEFDTEGSKNPDEFVTFLFTNCIFAVVITKDNDTAFRVFSVLNNRGLSLLPSDILKADIIGGIGENEQSDYARKWEDIEVSIGRESFNALLSHIRMIYAKSKLHETLVAEFKKYVVESVSKMSDVVSEIIEPFAYAYKSILENEYRVSRCAESINNLLAWLNRIDDSDWIPVIMEAMIVCNEPEQLQSILEKTERIAVYFYITSQTSNKRIERYSRALSYLQAKNYEDALKVLELDEKEKTLFVSTLEGDIYLMPARKRSYLILKLNYLVSDKATDPRNTVMSIEHVLPQNPASDSQWLIDWPDNEAREFWLHKIANLIPLAKRKNSQARNYDFDKKKKLYFDGKYGVTSFALATDVFNEDVWTPKSVELRQKRLIEYFVSYWNLSLKKQHNAEEKNILSKDVYGDNNIAENKGELFFLTSGTADAKGILEGKKFKVLVGSKISENTTATFENDRAHHNASRRRQLITEGIINNDLFVKDYTFNSPSQAASIILGRAANGKVEWHLASGKMLKDVLL